MRGAAFRSFGASHSLVDVRERVRDAPLQNSASDCAGRPVTRSTVSETAASSPAAIAVYVLIQASTCQSGAP